MSLTQITILFVAAALINSSAVYAQRRFKLYTRWFGRYDWATHVSLLSVIWTIFLLSLFLQLKPPYWGIPSALRPVGVVAIVIGLWLIGTTWHRLGAYGTADGWYFGRGPVKRLVGGIFKLRDPMYIGFTMLFVGGAFWHHNAAYLFLAATSYLLLNVLLAAVERPYESQ